jgi:hypothetical protein
VSDWPVVSVELLRTCPKSWPWRHQQDLGISLSSQNLGGRDGRPIQWEKAGSGYPHRLPKTAENVKRWLADDDRWTEAARHAGPSLDQNIELSRMEPWSLYRSRAAPAIRGNAPLDVNMSGLSRVPFSHLHSVGNRGLDVSSLAQSPILLRRKFGPPSPQNTAAPSVKAEAGSGAGSGGRGWGRDAVDEGSGDVVEGEAARDLLQFNRNSDLQGGIQPTGAASGKVGVVANGRTVRGRTVRGQEAKELLPRRDDRNWWDEVRFATCESFYLFESAN